MPVLGLPPGVKVGHSADRMARPAGWLTWKPGIETSPVRAPFWSVGSRGEPVGGKPAMEVTAEALHGPVVQMSTTPSAPASWARRTRLLKVQPVAWSVGWTAVLVLPSAKSSLPRGSAR